MRALLQRVSQASVTAGGQETGSIGAGLLVFVAFTQGDDEALAAKMLDRIIGLRIFEDSDGKMNLSASQVGASMLLVSQFTLYADTAKSGRRPSFGLALESARARPLYEAFCRMAQGSGLVCAFGVYGADMKVSLVNDGPVTLMLEI